MRDGKLNIERGPEFPKQGRVTQRVQCSPLLVWEGHPAFEGGPDEVALRRSFVATDEKGQWVMGCGTNLTLSGLAKSLAGGQVFTDLSIRTAMNLDGGPSSGAWSRDPQGNEHEFRAATVVQNLLALFEKETN